MGIGVKKNVEMELIGEEMLRINLYFIEGSRS